MFWPCEECHIWASAHNTFISTWSWFALPGLSNACFTFTMYLSQGTARVSGYYSWLSLYTIMMSRRFLSNRLLITTVYIYTHSFGSLFSEMYRQCDNHYVSAPSHNLEVQNFPLFESGAANCELPMVSGILQASCEAGITQMVPTTKETAQTTAGYIYMSWYLCISIYLDLVVSLSQGTLTSLRINW